MTGLQGAVGWWMVKSGLTQDVKVSHIRLATHLSLALTTLNAGGNEQTQIGFTFDEGQTALYAGVMAL